MKKDNLDFGNWIDTHQNTAMLILGSALTSMGILMIIGAIKDWDWLYAPDGEYHHKWTMGQISRYLGRGTARICGITGALFLFLPLGLMLVYSSLVKEH